MPGKDRQKPNESGSATPLTAPLGSTKGSIRKPAGRSRSGSVPVVTNNNDPDSYFLPKVGDEVLVE